MTEQFSVALSLIDKNNILKGLEMISQLDSQTPTEEQSRRLGVLMPKFTDVMETLISESSFKKAKRALSKLESIISDSPVSLHEEKHHSYIRIAEAYKNLSKFKSARDLLLQALAIPIDQNHTYHLLCSVMNDLKYHTQALTYVEKACSNAQESLIEESLNKKIQPETIKNLALSYYNLGKQLELIQKNGLAIEWYTKAYRILKKHGKQHTDLLRKVKSSLKLKNDSSNSIKKAPSFLRISSPYFSVNKSVDDRKSIKRRSKPKHSRNSLNFNDYVYDRRGKNKSVVSDIITEKSKNSNLNGYLMIFKPEEKEQAQKYTSKFEKLKKRYSKVNQKFRKNSRSQDFDIIDTPIINVSSNSEEFNKLKLINREKIAAAENFYTKDPSDKNQPIGGDKERKEYSTLGNVIKSKFSKELKAPNSLSSSDPQTTDNYPSSILKQKLTEMHLKKNITSKSSRNESEEKSRSSLACNSARNQTVSKSNTTKQFLLTNSIKNTVESEKSITKRPTSTPFTRNSGETEVTNRIEQEEILPSTTPIESKPIEQIDPPRNSGYYYDARTLMMLQSWVRGFLARRRARILKEQLKLKTIFKTKLMLDGEEYTATVLRNIKMILINLKNAQKNLSLELENDVDYMKVLSNILIDHGNIVVKAEEHDLRHIKKKKVKISNQICKLNFYSNDEFTLLLIKGKFKDSSHYIREENVPAYSIEQMKMFIKTEIFPHLNFDGSSLFLDKASEKAQKDLITSALIRSNYKYYESRVFTIKTLRRTDIMVEIDTPLRLIKQYFNIKKVLSIFDLETTEEFLADPHLLPLALKFENMSIVLQKPSSVDHVYLCKRSFNATEYLVKIYQLESFYFVVATGSPHLRSLVLTSAELSHFSQTDSNYSVIAKSIDASRGYLCIFHAYKAKAPMKEKEAALLIQKNYRCFRMRASFKLYILKHERNSGFLICRKARIIMGKAYILSLFKRNNAYIIEGSKQGSNTTDFKKIRNPYKYISRDGELSELLEIVSERNNKLIMTNFSSTYENKLLSVSHFADKIYRKIIMGEEYIIKLERRHKSTIKVELEACLGRRILSKIFLIKQINEDLGDWSVDTLQNYISIEGQEIVISKHIKRSKIEIGKDSPNILLRSSRVIQSKIYSIILKTYASTHEKLGPGDVLIFEARQGSDIKSNLEIEITVGEACDSTGFSSDEVLPMGYFIIKKMLIVTPEYLALDFAVPKFDINLYILKIQSWVRGFLTRRKFRKISGGTCFFSTRARIKSELFTISFFREHGKIYLVVVKGKKCWEMFLKTSLFDTSIDQADFITREVIPSLYFKTKSYGKVLRGNKSFLLESKSTNSLASRSAN